MYALEESTMGTIFFTAIEDVSTCGGCKSSVDFVAFFFCWFFFFLTTDNDDMDFGERVVVLLPDRYERIKVDNSLILLSSSDEVFEKGYFKTRGKKLKI